MTDREAVTMIYSEKFNLRTDEYEKQIDELMEAKSPFAGVFGIGHHPKNDPCHLVYYKDIQKMVDEFIASDPDAEEADDFAETLLKADFERGGSESFQMDMMYVPVQGFVISLAPYMSEAKKAELGGWFADAVPKRRRLPIQKDVCKALGVR